jgi:hypothetical protein
MQLSAFEGYKYLRPTNMTYYFHRRIVHPDIIKFLFIQLNAQLDYSRLKFTLKFTLKCS